MTRPAANANTPKPRPVKRQRTRVTFVAAAPGGTDDVKEINDLITLLARQAAAEYAEDIQERHHANPATP